MENLSNKSLLTNSTPDSNITETIPTIIGFVIAVSNTPESIKYAKNIDATCPKYDKNVKLGAKIQG